MLGLVMVLVTATWNSNDDFTWLHGTNYIPS